MPVLVFATNNVNKIKEIKDVVGDRFDIITLKEAGLDRDIPEPHDTLEANASEKSRTIYQITRQSCFGEDTGLEVEALNGAPGVKSARYAGEGRNSEENIDKLLKELDGVENRAARFRTVISLIWEGQEYLFEGICKGKIKKSRGGYNGFGFDSVFIPENSMLSFAEMSLEEKNKVSHRKKAVEKLLEFVDGIYNNKSLNPSH